MRISGYLTGAILLTIGFVAGIWFNGLSARGELSARRVLYYHDPMHPSYRSPKPGRAPDCDMPLVPVYADALPPPKPDHPNAHLAAGAVRITREQQQLIGIKLASVSLSSGPTTLHTLGRVAIDETRLYRLNAATEGFIQTTQPASVGSLVQRDQELATYYARELRSAVQAYLYVLERSATSESSRGKVDANLDQHALDLAIETLRNLGMSETQIGEIAGSRKAPKFVVLRSPVSGFVVARNVSPSQRFGRGDELYRIADLSRVWVEADLFDGDSRLLESGSPARITVKHLGSFPAKISATLPQFDGPAQTLRVRLEAGNPHFALKPGMFVDVDIPISLPAALAVPLDAIVDSGRSKTVFIETRPGYFEPRTVETGWQSGEAVQITKGLSVGDRIVVTGNFLIDSEVRMKGGVFQADDSTENGSPH